MWILLLALVAGAVVYAYSIRNTIQVASKPGCSSCPHAKMHEKTD
jgi:hypothetical protein